MASSSKRLEMDNTVETAGFDEIEEKDRIAKKLKMNLKLGCSDFDEIMEKDTIFIDKTMFIKEFMEDLSKVTCILRPRRFGKSTNLSILKSFLSIGAKPESFSRYLIGKETEFVEKHCGKYPVIYLNLKDCKGANWEKMHQTVWFCIRKMVERHLKDLAHLNLASFHFDGSAVMPQKSSTDTMFRLEWLMKELYKKYKRRVIVLVDEYDAPLNCAAKMGYYHEASEFFDTFYSSALKQDGESTLEMACLMGIVEVRGAGILSGLNNLKVYCSSDQKYSSYFGFLPKEVEQLVGKDHQHVIDWYNGYKFGSVSVINPWSFMNYLESQTLKSYWIESSYIETLSSFLDPHSKAALNSAIDLICNDSIEVSPLKPPVNYTATSWDVNSILHFLVHAGYLTYQEEPGSNKGLVFIPNEELRQHWKSEFFPMAKSFIIHQFQSSRCSGCF